MPPEPNLDEIRENFKYVTVEIYNNLSPNEQDTLEGIFQQAHGRIFANNVNGPFFKRWPTILTFDKDPSEQKTAGVEFRPLRRSDYGYPTLGVTQVSWGLWALQTAATLSIDAREALTLLLGSMLLNDYVMTELDESWFLHGTGASFVHNVQFGYLLYNYLFRNKQSNLVKIACVGEALGDLWCVYDEVSKNLEVGSKFSHRAHAAGIITGLLSGTILSGVFKS